MDCKKCELKTGVKCKNWRKFKDKHGFCPTECWSLDVTIAEFILPRLKYHRDHSCGYPACFDKNGGNRKWNSTLNKIIYAFEYTTHQWDGKKHNMNKVNEGMMLFARHFFDLWD